MLCLEEVIEPNDCAGSQWSSFIAESNMKTLPLEGFAVRAPVPPIRVWRIDAEISSLLLYLYQAT